MSPRSATASAAMRRATRAKLVAGSLEVFAERGFAAASMAEVARRAGVSKGLAYHYFDTKEALLEAALATHLDALLSLTERARKHADPADRLGALIDGLIEYVQAEPEAFRLYLGLVLQTPPGELEQSIARLREPLETYLAQVHALFVDLGAVDAEADATLFRAALLGVCLRIIMGDDAVSSRAIRSRLLRAFIEPSPSRDERR